PTSGINKNNVAKLRPYGRPKKESVMSSFIRRNEKPSPCTAKKKVSAIRGLFVAAGAIALLAPVFGHAVGDHKHGHGDGAGIEVISTRPDMVSGGDALI